MLSLSKERRHLLVIRAFDSLVDCQPPIRLTFPSLALRQPFACDSASASSSLSTLSSALSTRVKASRPYPLQKSPVHYPRLKYGRRRRSPARARLSRLPAPHRSFAPQRAPVIRVGRAATASGPDPASAEARLPAPTRGPGLPASDLRSGGGRPAGRRRSQRPAGRRSGQKGGRAVGPVDSGERRTG